VGEAEMIADYDRKTNVHTNCGFVKCHKNALPIYFYIDRFVHSQNWQKYFCAGQQILLYLGKKSSFTLKLTLSVISLQ